MSRIRSWRWVTVAAMLAISGAAVQAGELVIQSFDGTGKLSFGALNDGTNYNYRIEWAPRVSGPWQSLGAIGAFGHGTIQPEAGSSVTSSVPMFYRVVASKGDYLAIDISDGPSAVTYPVRYYRTLADVPGGPNSAAYKTTNILMRLIPKGPSTMGSPSGELGRVSDETPHLVTLTKSFYIGVFEVTQRQWELVMGTKPSYFTNSTYYASRPVERVSYYEIRENPNNSAISPNWPQSSQVHADSFMGKLRAKTGLTTFDLPTESQWEHACRAGTVSALNSGKNLTATENCPNMSNVGRYWYNGGSGYSEGCAPSAGTATAGSYQPNAWGLYDMHGNVWEWCLDWYGTYPGTVSDPPGGASGSYRVSRGGGWYNDARDCRSASRNNSTPSNRSNYYGFRLARTLP